MDMTPRYSLTIRVDFEASDDVSARLNCPRGRINQVLYDCSLGCGGKATAKLQRLNADSPPRLLARWPEE